MLSSKQYEVWRSRGEAVHASGEAGVPLWKMLSSTILIPLIPLQRRAHMAARCSQLSAPLPQLLRAALLRACPLPAARLQDPLIDCGTGKTYLGPKQVDSDWATPAAERPPLQSAEAVMGPAGQLAPSSCPSLLPSPHPKPPGPSSLNILHTNPLSETAFQGTQCNHFPRGSGSVPHRAGVPGRKHTPWWPPQSCIWWAGGGYKAPIGRLRGALRDIFP